ncbi:hypothetical protein FACS1894125_2970 [Actinomycetota bacterium]|nr:hypothetical protein FACS1894125_2970 [Actinomycetota bacterium]
MRGYMLTIVMIVTVGVLSTKFSSENTENSYIKIPEELTGTWCNLEETDCINFLYNLEELHRNGYPEASILLFNTDENGVSTYTRCKKFDLADHCSMALSTTIQYIPTDSNYPTCEARAKKYNLVCDSSSNYSLKHKKTMEYVVILQNHQQGNEFFDSSPFFRYDK